MSLLELKDVRIAYGSVEAVHGISLAVERGQIATILGANGAGKTTTLRAISGLIRPKSGSILLEDADIAVVAFGSTSRSVRYAVNVAREQGIRAGMFRIRTLWPFPDRQIGELAGRVKAIITPEMNLGMCTLEVRRCVEGKVPVQGIFRVDGEPINPDQILDSLKKVL